MGNAEKVDEKQFWSTIEVFAAYPFMTADGLKFRYSVNGNEIKIDQTGEVITRGNIGMVYNMITKCKRWPDTPGKRNISGKDYLYPIFARFKLIDAEREKNGYLSNLDNL